MKEISDSIKRSNTYNQSSWRRRDRTAKHKYLKSTGQEFFKINKKCLISYI